MSYATTIALGIPLTALLLGVQLRGERAGGLGVHGLAVADAAATSISRAA